MNKQEPQTAAEKREYLERNANLIFNVGTILEDREEITQVADEDVIWHFLYEHMDSLYDQVGRVIDDVQKTILVEEGPEEEQEGFPWRKLQAFKTIVISYHGAGDEGWIEDIQPEPPVEGLHLDHELYQEIEMEAYNILEGKYPGWEINEGSHGHITLTPADRKVFLHHGTIYEKTEWEDSVIE